MEALTDDNLPEEYRIALAKGLQGDLFLRVKCNYIIIIMIIILIIIIIICNNGNAE